MSTVAEQQTTATAGTDYTELRAALDALDIPGNWTAAGPSFGDDKPRYLNEVCVDDPDSDGLVVCVGGDTDRETTDRILAYIGEANPATVRRLLEERDALREAGQRVTDAFRALGRTTRLDGGWIRERRECESAVTALDAALARAGEQA